MMEGPIDSIPPAAGRVSLLYNKNQADKSLTETTQDPRSQQMADTLCFNTPDRGSHEQQH